VHRDEPGVTIHDHKNSLVPSSGVFARYQQISIHRLVWLVRSSIELLLVFLLLLLAEVTRITRVFLALRQDHSSHKLLVHHILRVLWEIVTRSSVPQVELHPRR
jgi:hypothetical protein